MNVALLILAFLTFAISLGVRAQRGKDMDLEQWSVEGRGFGTIFIFLLLAGEVFTTVTFLGASGWAYGRGGPAVFLLCGGPLVFAVGYWLLPAVWPHAKENRLHSQADFFASNINVGVVALLASAFVLVAVSLDTRITMTTDKAGASPDPALKASEDVRHMANNRELQEKSRACTSGKRTGDTSIEL